MKSGIAASALMLVATLLITSCGSDSSSSSATASFTTPTGTGYLRKSDTLWIVNLEGSYTDMGRQYGALLRSELGVLFTRMDAAIGSSNQSVTTMITQVKKQME